VIRIKNKKLSIKVGDMVRIKKNVIRKHYLDWYKDSAKEGKFMKLVHLGELFSAVLHDGKRKWAYTTHLIKSKPAKENKVESKQETN